MSDLMLGLVIGSFIGCTVALIVFALAQAASNPVGESDDDF